MIKDKSILAGILSLALDEGSTGEMALGGIPQGVKYEDKWFHTPLLSGHDASNPHSSTSPWYNISISYSFPGAENVVGSQGQPNNNNFAIVDSGSPRGTIPYRVLKALGEAIDPPATILPSYHNSSGLMMECNAKAPEFGHVIGAQTFKWKKEDWITEPNPWTDAKCYSKIISSDILVEGGAEAILAGQGFMRKVLTVFDVDNTEV